MRDSKPAVAARLKLLRQAALEDARRDGAFVLGWDPVQEGQRVEGVLMFVIAQVLAVAEDPACRRRAGS